VDRKIASSDTHSVSVGHGLFSHQIIHTAKRTACRYTNHEAVMVRVRALI
jgi:hypothetical protein